MAIEDVEGVPQEVLDETSKQLDQIEQETFEQLQEANDAEDAE
jgi:hypothetical protein